MTSILLSEIPEELLQRLRKKAHTEQTTVQEQIISILHRNLQSSPDFLESLDRFYEKYPRGQANHEDDPFANVRSQETGREVKL